MNIRFKCPCGKQWAVAEENAGKKAKCRQCGAVVVVPAASADAPVERPPPTQAAPAPSSPAGDCPSCGKWLDAGQVVCLECGFHRGKGARLALASEKPDPVSTEEPEPDDERWLDSEKFRDLLLRLPILVLSVLAVAPVCFVCWPIIRNIPILAVVTTGILSSGLFVLGPLGSLAGIVLGLLAVCRPAVRARPVVPGPVAWGGAVVVGGNPPSDHRRFLPHPGPKRPTCRLTHAVANPGLPESEPASQGL